jgi:hypothetical protein
MIGLLFFLIIVLGIAISGLFFLFNYVADEIDKLCDLMKEPYDRANYFESRANYFGNRIDSHWKYIQLYRDEVAELGKVLYKIQCDVEDLQEKTKR